MLENGDEFSGLANTMQEYDGWWKVLTKAIETQDEERYVEHEDKYTEDEEKYMEDLQHALLKQNVQVQLEDLSLVQMKTIFEVRGHYKGLYVYREMKRQLEEERAAWEKERSMLKLQCTGQKRIADTLIAVEATQGSTAFRGSSTGGGAAMVPLESARQRRRTTIAAEQSLRRELEAVQVKLEAAKESATAAEDAKRIAELEKAEAELKVELERLKAEQEEQVKELENELEKAQAEVSMLRQQVEALQRQLAAACAGSGGGAPLGPKTISSVLHDLKDGQYLSVIPFSKADADPPFTKADVGKKFTITGDDVMEIRELIMFGVKRGEEVPHAVYYECARLSRAVFRSAA